jgi:hypothetical protein
MARSDYSSEQDGEEKHAQAMISGQNGARIVPTG